MMRVALLALPVLVLATATVQHVTPVEKVIELLEKLSEQITEEGKKEAAQYDKFACFCKDEAVAKEVAITKANVRIEDLKAKIELLESEIAKLDSDAAAAKKEAAAVEKEKEKDAEVQRKQDAEYAEEIKDLEEAVDVMKRAIAALKAAKEKTEAAADGDAALLELGQLMSKHPALSSGTYAPVNALLAVVSGQEPNAYEHRSGEIIATLQELLRTFSKNLADKTEEAMTDSHEFRMVDSARAQKIGFLLDEAATKEKISAKKSEEKSELEGTLEEEEAALAADEAFLKDLTQTCEEKAKLFEQRSKFRADEITAISQALEELRGPVSSNYAANEMLTGFVQKSSAPTTPKDSDDDSEDAEYDAQAKADAAFLEAHASFVQVDQRAKRIHASHTQLRRAGARWHAERRELMPLASFLHVRAMKLRSVTLAALANRIRSGKDHFVKIRGLIKDLIAKLKEDAAAEADQKGFCDKEMKSAVDSRDEHQGDIESTTAKISMTEAKIAKLQQKIEELATEIAELYKALKEMEELRAKEKAQNEQTISDAKEGLEAVQNAMKILKDFYEGSMLQVRAGAPAKDSEGLTVGDKAPEIFEDEYKGKLDESKGIIGILEVIESDFKRTIDVVGKEEDAAAEQYKKDKADMEADLEGKKTEKKDAETELEEKAADLVEMKDDLKDSEKMLKEALEELEKLKPQCVDAAESWEERNAKRREEIEALKEAMRILDNWKH